MMWLLLAQTDPSPATLPPGSVPGWVVGILLPVMTAVGVLITRIIDKWIDWNKAKGEIEQKKSDAENTKSHGTVEDYRKLVTTLNGRISKLEKKVDDNEDYVSGLREQYDKEIEELRTSEKDCLLKYERLRVIQQRNKERLMRYAEALKTASVLPSWQIESDDFDEEDSSKKAGES